MSNINQFKMVTVGLCEGRHPLPVTGYIFPQVVEKPLDFSAHELEVRKFIMDHNLYGGNGILTAYVTGLTPCLTALINVCCVMGVNLTLMHFTMSRRRCTQGGDKGEKQQPAMGQRVRR